MKVFSELRGDVLTLAVNYDQKTIYASGVDSKVVCIRQVQLSKKQMHHIPKVIGQDNSGRMDINKDWVYSGNTRGQSHDIKSLIYLEAHHCLISGGVSTDLCIYPLEQHGKLFDSFKLKKSDKKSRKFLHIPPFELKNQVLVCTDLNADAVTAKSGVTTWQTEGIMILILRKAFTIEIWMYEQLKAPVFLLEFEKKGDFGITSVSVNAQATTICITDIEDTYVYKVAIGEDEVRLNRIKDIEGTMPKGVIYSRFLEGKHT